MNIFSGKGINNRKEGRTVSLFAFVVLGVTVIATMFGQQVENKNDRYSIGKTKADSSQINFRNSVDDDAYKFEGKISRRVLENYLSRAITMQNLLTGQGNLQDNIRMVNHIGAKFIGRALCLWNAANDFSNNVERAREIVPQVLAVDPDIILEACVFETVSPRVNDIAIPVRVFTAFRLPAEKRNFRYDGMIYPEGQRRPMGPKCPSAGRKPVGNPTLVLLSGSHLYRSRL